MAVGAAALLAACSIPGPPVRRDHPPTSGAAPTSDLVTTADAMAGIASGIDAQLTSGPEFGVDYSGLRAVLVLVDGQTVFERYDGSSPDDVHDVQGVTRSVLSTLVGIAVGEGRLRLDDRLPALLPQYASAMTPPTARMTLRRLLTMNAGFPGRSSGLHPGFERSPDWVRAILTSPELEPGDRFVDSDDGAHLVSAILERATGVPVLAYARSRLFDPLGISADRADSPPFDLDQLAAYGRAGVTWPVDPQGHATGYSWLKLRAGDLARIGQLYLDEGVWEGRRILPEAWVREATSDQSDAPVPDSAKGNGYGFLWWPRSVHGVPAYAALGYGGQMIEVVPSLRLVVVTAVDLRYEDATDHGVDTALLASFAESVVVPVIRGRG